MRKPTDYINKEDEPTDITLRTKTGRSSANPYTDDISVKDYGNELLPEAKTGIYTNSILQDSDTLN